MNYPKLERQKENNVFEIKANKMNKAVRKAMNAQS